MRLRSILLACCALVSGMALATYSLQAPVTRLKVTPDWRAPAPVCWNDQTPQDCRQASERHLRIQAEYHAASNMGND